MNNLEYIYDLGFVSYPNTAFDDNFSRAVDNMDPKLQESLRLILKSIQDEKEDELFYDMLISATNNREEIEIIESIRNDERKHNKLLRDLYFKFTGNMVPETKIPVKSFGEFNYKEQLVKALMGELEAVSKYQKVMKGFDAMEDHNVILEILTDELRHASKYNYLITKNNF